MRKKFFPGMLSALVLLAVICWGGHGGGTGFLQG